MSEKQQMMVKAPTKDQLVQSLYEIEQPYANYLDTLSPEKLNRIKTSVGRMRHGLHSVAPLMCMGPQKCLFIEHCPIPPRTTTGGPVMNERGTQIVGPDKDYPMARPCVMETFYMQQKIIDYVEHLDVDPANPIEMSIVNELSLIDLLKNRALIILSKGDRRGDGQDFMRVDVTGYDSETGTKSESTSIHPAAEMLDRLEKRRERWLDKLVETRKAKIDAAHKLGNTDTSSKVLTELAALREALDAGNARQIQNVEDVMEIPLDD